MKKKKKRNKTKNKEEERGRRGEGIVAFYHVACLARKSTRENKSSKP